MDLSELCKEVSSTQYHQCANKPGSNLEGLEAYGCPLWKKSGDDKGCFNELGYEICLIRGGGDRISKLQALCKSCYMYKNFITALSSDRYSENSNNESNGSNNESSDTDETSSIEVLPPLTSSTKTDYRSFVAKKIRELRINKPGLSAIESIKMAAEAWRRNKREPQQHVE